MVLTSEGKSPAVATRLGRAKLSESRGRIYWTLSLAYARSVDRQLLELLRPWGTLEEQLPPGALPALLKRGLRRLGAWLARHGPEPSEESLTALGVEFTRLFRGLHPLHSPLPPYESVYGDGGLLYGAATQRLAQKYRRYRLKGHNNEPPDHIALELDFMRFLCEREARAWRAGKGSPAWLREEDAFLKEHLAPWVPDLCQNIRQFDTTGFYAGLADITEGWITCDQRLIQGLTQLIR